MAITEENVDVPIPVVVRSGTVQVQVLSGHISIQSGKIAAQVSGTVAISGLVGVQSGHVSVQSGKISVSSGEVHVLSGQLIAKVSGEIVSTRPDGSAITPFSGYDCTNAYVYSGFGFTTYGKATVMLECLGEGSGVSWTTRGEAVSGVTTYSIASGQLTSGEVEVQTITDPYDYLEIGVENTVDNYTGTVTITVSRR